MLLIIALGTFFLALIVCELLGFGQNRSHRVICRVPVTYTTGVRMRQGCLLDLSCNGCKLRTEGEGWDCDAKVWIGVGNHDLIGTVTWANRRYAGIDLHQSIEPDEVDKIAFGGAGDLMGPR